VANLPGGQKNKQTDRQFLDFMYKIKG
jgi:hypothetical protein